MAYFILCQAASSPCPVESQEVVVEPSLEAFEAIGLTPADAASAIGIGFALVFSLGVIGYVVAVAVGLVKQT